MDSSADASRLDQIVARLEGLLDAGISLLPGLAVAVIIVAIAWALGRLLGSMGFFFRWAESSFVGDLARRGVRKGVLALGVIIALDVLGAGSLLGAVLGAAGILGIAVGFAFRDLVENYIAGILLSLRQPFAPKDSVEIDGHAGTILRLTSRATILMTFDGNHLRLPNALVFKGVILNYTRNPLRRFDFTVGVATGEDLDVARSVGLAALTELDAVVADPPPRAQVTELGDSTVTIQFFAWVDQTAADFLKARSVAIARVKVAFDEAEVEMPEPIYRVHWMQGLPAQASSPPKVRPDVAIVSEDTAVTAELAHQIADERAAERDLLDDQAARE